LDDSRKSITKTRNLENTKYSEYVFVVSSFRDFVMKLRKNKKMEYRMFEKKK